MPALRRYFSAQIGKGQPEPHDAVHLENYSGNKGLGTSHIVYVNVRGQILRVSLGFRPGCQR